MWISGCGYACSECVLREYNKCEGCSPENKLTSLCPIYKCIESKGYDTCLRCLQRMKCRTYSRALKQCPIRRSICSNW
ncbi:MAG TPA: DUF3795 domain-containing protein [Methanomassiliicoccales archaeon]|nr:DUF3795 domain-containing protein [Methanomassiliicoccales archaeon]